MKVCKYSSAGIKYSKRQYQASKIDIYFLVSFLPLGWTILASVARTEKQKKLHGSKVNKTLVALNDSLCDLLQFLKVLKNPRAIWPTVKD